MCYNCFRERAESIKLTFFICKLFSTCSSAEKTGDMLETNSKSKVGITDQTGAKPAARQVAKGRGAALQVMAQGLCWTWL